MKFMEAIDRLGPGQKLGVEGTDWSWWYQWKHSGAREGLILVDEEGVPATICYEAYKSDDWIIK